MRLEYLFENKSDCDVCLSILNSDANKERIGKTGKKQTPNHINVGDHYYVYIDIESESQDVAKILSDIDEEIRSTINKCKTLHNGAAAYFNRYLYPKINHFEIYLRKVLYIASARKGDSTNIDKLEEKDFGEIFELLFLDHEYQTKVKAYVNGKNDKESWRGYSQDLQNYLDGLEENVLWDKILNGKVPTLRNQFNEIRVGRNAVMHAHNITKDEFNRINKLFDKVNKEVIEALHVLVEGELDIPDEYNSIIADAMREDSSISGHLLPDVTAEDGIFTRMKDFMQ